MDNDIELPTVAGEPAARDTIPTNDAEPPVPVIPAGQAQAALAAALDELLRAVMAVEAIGMALARQLDSNALAGRGVDES